MILVFLILFRIPFISSKVIAQKDQEIKDIRADAKTKIRAAEQRARDTTRYTTEALRAERAVTSSRLAALSSRTTKIVKQQREDIHKQSAIIDVKSSVISDKNAKMKSVVAKHRSDSRTVKKKHESKMETAVSNHKAEKITLKSKNDTLKSKHDSTIITLKSKHDSTIQSVHSEHQAKKSLVETEHHTAISAMQAVSRSLKKNLGKNTKLASDRLEKNKKQASEVSCVKDNLESSYNEITSLRRQLQGTGVRLDKLVLQADTKQKHNTQELSNMTLKHSIDMDRMAIKHNSIINVMQNMISVRSINLICLSTAFYIYQTLLTAHFVSQQLKNKIDSVTPRLIAKESSKSGGLQWGWKMHQLMLELLSHRTPPSCVSANVLTVAEILSPNYKIAKELFSVSFVRKCRSELTYATKLLAAYQLAQEEVWLQHFSDGTKRRQIDIQNSVIRIARNGGYKNICLDSGIMSEDETAILLNQAIQQAFKEGRDRLTAWRAVTARQYPGREDLLALIPLATDLTLAKLAKGGYLTTDTCNPARAFRRRFKASIIKIAINEGMTQEEICLFEVDCWHHLRNVWFGRVTLELGEWLKDVLADDLEKIHYSLRVTTDIVGILRAIEKYFGGTANYAKGKGSLFMDYMRRYHPTAYLYSISRACGGARQDIGVEGAIAVLMNIPYYLEFLIWRFRCGGDGILEKNLWLVLRSVEFVALLRVLSILHLSVCMPMRWLAGNCGALEEYDFGVSDMPAALDLMDNKMADIVEDGSLLLSDDFMMSMFDDLHNGMFLT